MYAWVCRANALSDALPPLHVSSPAAIRHLPPPSSGMPCVPHWTATCTFVRITIRLRSRPFVPIHMPGGSLQSLPPPESVPNPFNQSSTSSHSALRSSVSLPLAILSLCPSLRSQSAPSSLTPSSVCPFQASLIPPSALSTLTHSSLWPLQLHQLALQLLLLPLQLTLPPPAAPAPPPAPAPPLSRPAPPHPHRP